MGARERKSEEGGGDFDSGCQDLGVTIVFIYAPWCAFARRFSRRPRARIRVVACHNEALMPRAYAGFVVLHVCQESEKVGGLCIGN